MRWIRAAGRGLLVAAVVLTGYVASGTPADGAHGAGRGPLTLATAGTSPAIWGHCSKGGTVPTPASGSPSSNSRTPPTRRTRR